MTARTEEKDQAHSRSMVVAAVDGMSKPEFDFLAAAWRKYGRLSAYDPEMKVGIVPGQLKSRGVQQETCTVVKGSVIAFGSHVPNTDLLVPHPGPWVTALTWDLPSCLDHVLGADSRAYVFTDNEPDSAQAENLKKGIEEINAANASKQGYRPMDVTVSDVLSKDLKSYDLCGVTLTIAHKGGFRLTEIARN